MGMKNSQIHIFLETNLKETIERESKKRGVTTSELCRQKLKESTQLTRIEILLEKILERGADFSKPKAGKSALRK